MYTKQDLKEFELRFWHGTWQAMYRYLKESYYDKNTLEWRCDADKCFDFITKAFMEKIEREKAIINGQKI